MSYCTGKGIITGHYDIVKMLQSCIVWCLAKVICHFCSAIPKFSHGDTLPSLPSVRPTYIVARSAARSHHRQTAVIVVLLHIEATTWLGGKLGWFALFNASRLLQPIWI